MNKLRKSITRSSLNRKSNNSLVQADKEEQSASNPKFGATQDEISKLFSSDDEKKLKKFIEANKTVEKLFPAVFNAARNGNVTPLNVIKSNNKDLWTEVLQHTTEYGWSIFTAACVNNKAEVVSFILKNLPKEVSEDALGSAVDKAGWTNKKWAEEMEFTELAKQVPGEAKGDGDLKDRIFASVEEDHFPITESVLTSLTEENYERYLREKKTYQVDGMASNQNPLMAACYLGRLELVKLILKPQTAFTKELLAERDN